MTDRCSPPNHTDPTLLRVEEYDLCPQAIAPLRGAWDQLINRAIESNPFLDHATLTAAHPMLDQRAWRLICLWHHERLIGLYAGRKRWRLGKLPLPHLSGMQHNHLFFGAPLVDRDFVESFAVGLFNYVDRTPLSEHFAVLPLLNRDGPIYHTLVQQALMRTRLCGDVKRLERAYLKSRANDDFDARLTAALSARTRKSVRAKRRKLSEHGLLSYCPLSPQDDASEWVEVFLKMENAGWKGAQGTSALSDPAVAAYYRQLAKIKSPHTKLRMAALELNKRPIAISLDFACGDTAFALKIAHDPAFERYSPGVILEHENLRAFCENKKLRSVDSCAQPNHPVLNQLWEDRRSLAHLMIVKKNPFSEFIARLYLNRRFGPHIDIPTPPATLPGVLEHGPKTTQKYPPHQSGALPEPRSAMSR